METFTRIANALGILERKQFERIRTSFRWPEALRAHIRGSLQFYAVDKPKELHVERLPVICAAGMNYTQNGRTSSDLFPYDQDGIGVVRSTALTAAVLSVVRAYERKRAAWTSLPAVDPPSPMKFYALTLNPISGPAGLAKNRQNYHPIAGGFAHAKAPLPRTDRRGPAAG